MKINKKLLKRLTSLVLCTTMLGNLVACGKPTEEELIINPLNVSDDYDLYSVENSVPKFYQSLDISKYDMVMYDPYEYKGHYSVYQFNEMVSDGATNEDVIDTINNNDSMDSKLKDILITGLNNLKENNVDINLNILKYNLERIKVKHIDSIKSDETMITAKFDAFKQEVLIDDKLAAYYDYNKLICHEILGHGSTQAYYKEEELYFNSTVNIKRVMNGETDMYCPLGYSFDEALADYIAIKATNKKIDNATMDGIYSEQLYAFLIMCESLDITPNDYIQYGMNKVLDIVREKKLSDSLGWITNLDVKNMYMICANIDTGFSFNDIVYNYMRAVMNEDSTIDKDKINKMTDSYKDYIIPYNYNGHEYIITGTQDLLYIDIQAVKDAIMSEYNNTHKTK